MGAIPLAAVLLQVPASWSAAACSRTLPSARRPVAASDLIGHVGGAGRVTGQGTPRPVQTDDDPSTSSRERGICTWPSSGRWLDRGGAHAPLRGGWVPRPFETSSRDLRAHPHTHSRPPAPLAKLTRVPLGLSRVPHRAPSSSAEVVEVDSDSDDDMPDLEDASTTVAETTDAVADADEPAAENKQSRSEKKARKVCA